MKFCVHCGKECLDDAIICPACGCSVQYGNRSAYTNQTQGVPPFNQETDKYSVMSILGFVFAFVNSIVGLILSIIAFKDAKKTGSVKSENFAKAGIIISSIALGLSIILTIIICIIYFSFLFGMLGMIV